MSRREGVFLRTSKTGSTHHRLRLAFRLVRVEALLAIALYACAGILAAERRPPLLLVAIVAFQATVYACAPIASFWNLRAQRLTSQEYRRRFEQRRLRDATRRRTM